MAQLGRIEITLSDTSGNSISSASVEVRRQGATVNGDQSGTTPLTVTVNDPGAIVAGDMVGVNAGTVRYSVDSVAATSVTVSGYTGTLSLTDDDRLSPTNNLPSLYRDTTSTEAASNPLTTNSRGTASAR